MSPMEHPLGAVCWLDLGVPDVAGAADFYGQLFGWSIAQPDSDGYRLAAADGELVAALGPAEDHGTPYWTVYLHTKDITATTAAVVTAGGVSVVPPSAVGDIGTAAVVRDPYGGPLSLWQPGTHSGTHASGGHGTLHGVRYRTDDPQGAAAFFHAVAGWQLAPDGRFTVDGVTVARCAPGLPGAPSPWLVEFAVADAATAVAGARELGARSLHGEPTVMRDPWGTVFALR